MKTVLLTGSSGYIGTNFIELYREKYNIITMDKKEGYNVLNATPHNFYTVNHVVHLAAISGIKQCESDLDETYENNIFSTVRIVNNLRGTPITFASSQAAKDPNNTYACTKRISENYIKTNADKYSILRFANVYGGLNYLTTKTSVVAKFINARTNKEPLIVNGDGSQERDFIHVYDVCKAIDCSIETSINDTVDIGTGIGTTINDLANMISRNIVYRDGITGTESNIADTSKAKKLLGFEADTDLFCEVSLGN